MSDVLIKAEGVSKKFCKSLKRLMLYGMQDIARTMLGMSSKTDELRSGEFWANDDISFELRRGECLGLIGPNGSGKSTLLKILNGIISPDKGRIEIRGRVGALIEIGAGFHPMLTGRENIYINGSILGFSKKEIDKKFDEIVEFAEIEDFLDTPVKLYSSGMRVRLGFAVAAQMEPDVLLIDEVLAVGDVGFRVKCLNRVSKILKNCAVIFVSHAMPQVARVATDIMVMDGGKKVFYDYDIPKGINTYYSLFSNDDSFSYGSNKVELKHISASNGRNQDSKGAQIEICFGDNLYFDFTLNLHSKIESIGIRVSFIDMDTKVVADSQSHDLLQSSNMNEKIINVHSVVNGLTLNDGAYSLNLELFEYTNSGTKGEIYLFKSNFFKVISTGATGGVAPVKFTSEWAIVKQR